MTTAAMEFDDFVRDRSARLLRLAYLFTRDHALAEDLLQTTYARCWGSWRRIEGDPEPYVRRALVNTYNSWWRRRWTHELPSDELPDAPVRRTPQDTVDARDEVWRALRRLPRQQQTVIVLRYFEDLTEAQIADVMQISSGAVKGYASKALARLRQDPTLSTVELPTPEPTPAGNERVAGVHDRIRRARRVKLATAGTAVLVLLSLMAAFVVGFAARHKPVPTPVNPSPSPSVSVSPSPIVFGAPGDYFDGKRIVAQLPATKPGQVVAKVRWTPRPDHLAQLFFLCVRQKLPDVVAHLWINGKPTDVTMQCDSGDPIPKQWWLVSDFEAMDLDPSQGPTTFEVRLSGVADPVSGSPAAAVKDGSVAMIVVERSTTAEYLYPSRPARLDPLPRPSLSPGAERVHTFRSGEPLSARVSWPGVIAMEGRSNTPGILHIAVNGDEIGTLSWWDYSNEWRRQCHDGALVPQVDREKVTVTVTPEHVTGDWSVDLVIPDYTNRC